MKNHFTITIRCKYYAKVYLENNCGSPADLSVFPDLYCAFKNFLTKNIEDPEEKLKSTIGEPETIDLIIPNDWFYRYGFLMSKVSINAFNRLVESKIKCIMRQYLTFNISMGKTAAESIINFQDEYCLPDSVWSTETIKKDYQRNGDRPAIKAHKSLKAELRLFLAEGRIKTKIL